MKSETKKCNNYINSDPKKRKKSNNKMEKSNFDVHDDDEVVIKAKRILWV